jgi:nucleoside-diphosphate-sugar epimerase
VKILLTGATGFLGSHLVKRLEHEPVKMFLLVRPGSNLSRIEHLPANAELIEGDLANLPANEIKAAAPDTVIHAAWHGVTNQHRNDSSQIDQNLGPTLRLLELARDAGSKTFIGLGSQAEYGPLNRKCSETDLTEPTTLYGATKLAACHLTRQLAAQAGMRWAWLRVFSTYGPEEDPSWMIPYLIGKLLRRERPALTRCEQIWDFLYGPDAADAIWSVAKTPTASGIFNLGSGQGESLLKIVETLRDEVAHHLSLQDPLSIPLGIGEVPYRPDQVMRLEADISRLTGITGWKPATSLAQGLQKTISFHAKRDQIHP